MSKWKHNHSMPLSFECFNRFLEDIISMPVPTSDPSKKYEVEKIYAHMLLYEPSTSMNINFYLGSSSKKFKLY